MFSHVISQRLSRRLIDAQIPFVYVSNETTDLILSEVLLNEKKFVSKSETSSGLLRERIALPTNALRLWDI